MRKFTRKALTYSLASIRFDDNQHCNISTKCVSMLTHFTYNSANTVVPIKSLIIII
jgi:hypothetical protein